MSGFELDIDYLSFKISDLEGLAREILSPQILEKAMHAALNEVENSMKINFTERQGEWKPLAISTQHQRMRQGYGPQSPILVRSGTLMENAASGREVEITGDELRGDVFPNDDAAPPYGTSSIGDYMEALDSIRPFYNLSEQQMTAVYAAFENSLTESLGLT
jgi:hypothetical protein